MLMHVFPTASAGAGSHRDTGCSERRERGSIQIRGYRWTRARKAEVQEGPGRGFCLDQCGQAGPVRRGGLYAEAAQMGSDQSGEAPLLQAGACPPPRLLKGPADGTVTVTCLS